MSACTGLAERDSGGLKARRSWRQFRRLRLHHVHHDRVNEGHADGGGGQSRLHAAGRQRSTVTETGQRAVLLGDTRLTALGDPIAAETRPPGPRTNAAGHGGSGVLSTRQGTGLRGVRYTKQ